MSKVRSDISFVTLDVFTDQIFGGNPLAVVLDATGMSDQAMQSIACEFNLSETTFVLPPTDSANTHGVRIFTPVAELPFAGHPTLGTAIAIALANGTSDAAYRFEEGVGVVEVNVRPSAEGPLHATLSVAKLPDRVSGSPTAHQWANMLSLSAASVCPHGQRAEMWSCGTPFSFTPVCDLEALEQAFIDAGTWRADLADSPSTGAFVFTLNTESKNVDVRARMFAPAHGITEDPATGSAVAALAGWLADHMKPADGTHEWVVEQGVEMGRPSRLHLAADIAQGAVQAVRVGGTAVPVSSGVITIS